MTIPDYQSLMLPVLRFLSDGEGKNYREIVDALADDFQLSSDERKELLPSGQQPIFKNRVGWARTYLKQAGLIEYPKRGINRITQRGLQVLDDNPNKIDIKFLQQYKEFIDFKSRKKNIPKKEKNGPQIEQNPEETLENAYENLRNDLASELLRIIKSNPPSLFEKIVVELLVKMGYGGSRRDAGKAVGQTKGDWGSDQANLLT